MDVEGVRPRIVLITTTSANLWVFFRDQCAALVEQGFEVSAICNPGPELVEFKRVTGCEIHRVPMTRSISLRDDVRSVIQIHRLLRRIKPDLVHSHTPKAGLLGMAAAWAAGVKIRIHTFHGLRSETLQGFRRSLVEHAEMVTAGLSTMSLAVSHSLRDLLIANGICKPGKLQVIGFGGCAGVDIRQFTKSVYRLQAEALRQEAQIEPGSLVVSYIGRIARDKGLEVLAKAWPRVKANHADARLCIAGPIDLTDPVSPEVLSELEKDPTVRLRCGFTDEVTSLLAATQVFVSPSFREGLGVAALEASAMELPVVVSHVTGLVDAAEHGVTGFFVEPRNAVQLANAIGRLLQDGSLREEFGQNGRKFVEHRFDRVAVFKGLVSSYRASLRAHSEKATRQEALAAFTKRSLDLFVAVSLLLVASPILLLSMLGTLASIGGPVFFTQSRGGKDGKRFNVLKLRTMRTEVAGELADNSDAARLTRFGMLLRKLSIDELPQLINVIRGEMSLVGPRPLLAAYLERYDSEQARRHEVRPGITGWSQIYGRNSLSWEKKFEYDVWYVDHQSFWLDLRILALTVLRVLRPQGITAAGNATMSEFTGNTKRSNSQQHLA